MKMRLFERNINIRKEKISYYDSERGKNTLLFIHGAFINKNYWSDQINFFGNNYRVIALDLAGHGASTANGSDWSFERYGHDLSSFIKKLSLTNVVLIGHSNGADIMLECAALNNTAVSGLIAVDYFKNIGVPLPTEVVSQTLAGLKSDFAGTNEQYARQALLNDKTNTAIVERVVNDFRNMPSKVGVPFNEYAFNYTHREVNLLKKLLLKLYIINADYAPTNEENILKTLGKNYELHLIKGTSHFPMIENPQAFNKSLAEALSKIVF